MNPKLAALSSMMGAAPSGGGDPTEEPMMPVAPENEEQPIPDEGAAVSQAIELLAPFSQNPQIREVLAILEAGSGEQTGPPGGVPEDMMLMEEEGNLVA